MQTRTLPRSGRACLQGDLGFVRDANILCNSNVKPGTTDCNAVVIQYSASHVRIQTLRISCKVGVFVISHEKVGVLVIVSCNTINGNFKLTNLEGLRRAW